MFEFQTVKNKNKRRWLTTFCLYFTITGPLLSSAETEKKIDFNRDIRQILSNNCFFCHGPDKEDRKGDLRLDTFEGATKLHKGRQAIVPGHPEKSELIARITTHDVDDVMPPADSAKEITEEQLALLKAWIKQGAHYAKHWAYVKPEQPELPSVQQKDWIKNPIDQFILAKLEENNLKPSKATDRLTLVRRLALDLTGLPPSAEEVEKFINDKSPNAIETYVDHLMSKDTYGEHWASMWLDLARYADSAGYADDRKRTIWSYRDYVIRSFNQNKPFDQFTREQLAGDLLPNPSEQQLVATAFHRNTQTNSEGGTVDEEFRNAAVVDRVNTTLAVWMGTTMGCAQCHTHKYDPITQEEYFQVFSILNNTEDADRPNESPVLELWSEEQKQTKVDLNKRITSLENILKTPSQQTKSSQRQWKNKLAKDAHWHALQAPKIKTEGEKTTASFPLKLATLSGLKVHFTNTIGAETYLHHIEVQLIPKEQKGLHGQYVRIKIPGNNKYLSLAEVQVFSEGKNIAPSGTAKSNNVYQGAEAKRAIDNNTDGNYNNRSVSHTKASKNPWWELNLKSSKAISDIVIWNRTDGNLQSRLNGAVVEILDSKKKSVWKTTLKKAPQVSQSIFEKTIPLRYVRQDLGQNTQDLNSLLSYNRKNKAFKLGKDINLIATPDKSIAIENYSSLKLTLKHSKPTTGLKLEAALTSDEHLLQKASLPIHIIKTLNKKNPNEQELKQLELHYLSQHAPELNDERKQLASSQNKLKNMKPHTSVPIFKQLPTDKERVTKVQLRGNYLVTGKVVEPGITKQIHPFNGHKKMTRMDLVDWLMDSNNPLTARVTVNRYWEKIFGMGIVSTSDEFGSQGELPSHPELLDWLALKLIDLNWDLKKLLKLIVTSSTYQQSSKVSAELQELDPVNRLLSRAPRVRLSAEMVRDQALAASGLLSKKLYGPPVHPPQPNMGLKAAFGASMDWKTSEGEDRYRRSLYTEWRRSNPYPSMVTFDAPNREVCVVKRDSSNTPLQALVTMNDPVYIEAAQSLARRSMKQSQSDRESIAQCFKLCLTREPLPKELETLTHLYEDTYQMYKKSPEEAKKMATIPLGPLLKDQDATKLAAMTVVANIVLNLDEMFIKR